MSARSYLYVPADNLERLNKALNRGADALIVDLEDGVAPSNKNIARENLRVFLNNTQTSIEIWVRVNSEEEALKADLDFAVHKNCHGIVLAKTTSADDVQRVDSILTTLEKSQGIEKKLEISALIESASGVFNAQAIAAAPRVTRLQLGEADLRADLAISGPGAEVPLQFARNMVIFASSAAGINPPLAAVSIDFRDLDAYRISTENFKAWGYFGRTCIHPDQLQIVNEVFTPSPEEIAAAQDIVDRLSASGGGVALDAKGRMIDEAIARSARRILNITK